MQYHMYKSISDALLFAHYLSEMSNVRKMHFKIYACKSKETSKSLEHI